MIRPSYRLGHKMRQNSNLRDLFRVFITDPSTNVTMDGTTGPWTVPRGPRDENEPKQLTSSLRIGEIKVDNNDPALIAA